LRAPNRSTVHRLVYAKELDSVLGGTADGKLLACSLGGECTDKQIARDDVHDLVWNSKRGEVVAASFDHNLYRVEVRRDGGEVAIGRPEPIALVEPLGHQKITSVSLDPGTNDLYVGLRRGGARPDRIARLRADGDTQMDIVGEADLRLFADELRWTEFVGDGRALTLAFGTVDLWNLSSATASPLLRFEAADRHYWRAHWLPDLDPDMAAAVRADGTVEIWSLEKGLKVGAIPAPIDTLARGTINNAEALDFAASCQAGLCRFAIPTKRSGILAIDVPVEQSP
jgi:hypothetical protein